MFTLKVKDKFCAAHQLIGYPGDCANLHGHTWKVEVVIVGLFLDELEMLVDFRDVKGALKEVLAPLDHAGSLNDILHIDLPTAEYLAWYIFHELKDTLEHLGLPVDTELKAVTVWESENASITYDREGYE
jgi:6-pyruvoyltetrahydropterin/6-carboxytetrahydropterin synthase